MSKLRLALTFCFSGWQCEFRANWHPIFILLYRAYHLTTRLVFLHLSNCPAHW